MRRYLAFVLWIWVFFTSFSAFAADSIVNFLDNLWQDTLFWYTTDKQISTKSISTTKFVIESPVILDDFNEKIVNYTVIYSKYPLAEILDNTALLSESMEKNYTNLDLASKSTFDIELLATDGISADQIYYVSVVPKDQNDILWEVSNELCFKLSTQTTGEGDECKTWWGTHGAGSDMTLASVSHTQNGNQITLKWISVAGSTNVDIFLWDDAEGSFNKLATKTLSSESYTFTATRNGEHIVKFIPDNWWKETTYTFNVSGIWATPTTPPPAGAQPGTVTTVPKVWPKQNIWMIIILSFVGYLLYRGLFKKKHARR